VIYFKTEGEEGMLGEQLITTLKNNMSNETINAVL
jgi:hypothetical protein